MKNFFSGEEMDKNRDERWDDNSVFVTVIDSEPYKPYEPVNLWNKKKEQKKDKYDFFGWNKKEPKNKGFFNW